MFVEKAGAPDVYRVVAIVTRCWYCNQTIAALDSLGPAKLHGIDPATGDKRKNECGNVAV